MAPGKGKSARVMSNGPVPLALRAWHWQGQKVVPRGLEPRTLRLLAVRSNQLSYETRCCPVTGKLTELGSLCFRCCLEAGQAVEVSGKRSEHQRGRGPVGGQGRAVGGVGEGRGQGRRGERGRGRRGGPRTSPPLPPACRPERGPRLLGEIRIFKLLIKTNNSRAPAGRSAEIVPILRPT